VSSIKIQRHTIALLGIGLVLACLFGAATPASKALLTGIQPQVLAGLLYLGAGHIPGIGIDSGRLSIVGILSIPQGFFVSGGQLPPDPNLFPQCQRSIKYTSKRPQQTTGVLIRLN